MKKRPAKEKSTTRKPSEHSGKSKAILWLVLFAAVVLVIGAGIGKAVWLRAKKGAPQESYRPRSAGQLTFNKDIAPIVFRNCAGCHRPGQSAPFALLSYADAKKHAKDMATVTAQRYMPPWLPEHGYGEFVGERRLSVDEIGMIQQWAAEGAAEGAPSELPPLPDWSGDWQLGNPDLIVSMPQPYTLSAEGRDVYRNFVIPGSVSATRYVRGVEFHPGNSKVVHHAFIRVDPTAQSRNLDARDAEQGFGGMSSPAKMPDGHFLGWQPGRVPAFVPEGLAWRLDPGADLVVEMHLNPSGRPEPVQPSIGLYFTDRAPTNTCFKMTLTSYIMDIPVGAPDYVVEDNFRLPVDVQILAVLPHAHYLAKEMQGWATLPDGTKRWLLLIKQWDFNWQGDYRYKQPVFLPKGSVLSMRYTYDNSTNNVRNPNRPLKPVTYGPQSSDEMAELWFQLLPRNEADLAALERDYQSKLSRLFREADEYTLRKNPNDVKANIGLGLALLGERKLSDAERHFRVATQAKPDDASAHYYLGLAFRQQNRLSEARAAFEASLRFDPNDFKSHGNLGFICLEQGDLNSAQLHFESALRLNPSDTLARNGLNQILQTKGGLRNPR